MNKQTAIQKAGSVRNLATLLGVTHQAVYAWGDELPELQVFRLRKMKPRWFWAQKPAAEPASSPAVFQDSNA